MTTSAWEQLELLGRVSDPPQSDLDLYLDLVESNRLKCHFCEQELHEDNNIMAKTMEGKPIPAFGFGWLYVIVQPFRQVPCCDVCLAKPKEELPGFVMA